MRANSVDVKTDRPKKLLIDIGEVCETLGCSRALVYNLIRRGELRSVKLGRATRFRPADLEALIDRLAAQ